ncbi:MAG TPA: HAMP domain-containing sensor histidine kinase [Gemmatimonadales bacterium]|nr:HAMP domain-containing sensor histidine kinase [Gemmatimonadales bacterium]
MTVRGQSIKVKLPALIGGLLVAVTLAYGWAAYGAVRRSSAAAAVGRLGAVTDQLAQLLKASRDQLVAAVRAVADSPAVRDYASRPAAGRQAAAEAALRPGGPQGQQVAAVELWGPDRRRLLVVGTPDPWTNAAGATALMAALSPADSGIVGPFRAVADSLVYGIAAPVVAGGRLRGYVVQWRRVASSADTKEQNNRLNRLIGSDAHLFVGNAADDVWTDLSKRVPPPPVDVSRGGSVLQYARAGIGPVLAAARPVARTPWVVLLEFPRGVVLAPAREFLAKLTLIGAAILIVGLLAAWAASLTLTRPLTRLTHAAEAVAAGDYAQPVAHQPRGDELGRLAGAFDVMVQHVRESQQRLEERVRARTRELEERNQELETFAYSISHDLRSPLRAMEGFSHALLEDHGDQLDETGRRHAERVAAAARTMDRLIDDLLAYSRLTRSELDLAAIDLERVLRGSLQQVDADVRSRNARVDIADSLPAVVGHGPTLAQVLANLLANAIKFVAPGRTPEVRVRAEPRDGLVRLWVEDNGIGIAPEHHERIFRVFERLHRSPDYPGTGIGLAIVRKAMERMGGRAGVESELGRGSRFWIELPRADRG